MSVKPVILYSFLITFACWLFGLCLFALFAYTLKFSALPNADAIVVLTGGADRLATALSLLDQNKAPRMFISGVNSKVSTGALFAKIDESLIHRIDLGYEADNTFENAVETTQWMQKNKIRSILLVTSFYHMPRSLFELKTYQPNVEVYPVPVFIQTKQHWGHTRSAWLVFEEYNKLIVRYVQFLIRRIFL